MDSSQITAYVNKFPNPEEKEYEIWQKTRYLVAQEPATPSFTENTMSHYRGRQVVPGPKANPRLMPRLQDTDYELIKHRYFIRFTDNITTQDADASVGRSLYTVMSDVEADDYEKWLASQLGIDLTKKKEVEPT